MRLVLQRFDRLRFLETSRLRLEEDQGFEERKLGRVDVEQLELHDELADGPNVALVHRVVVNGKEWVDLHLQRPLEGAKKKYLRPALLQQYNLHKTRKKRTGLRPMRNKGMPFSQIKELPDHVCFSFMMT